MANALFQQMGMNPMQQQMISSFQQFKRNFQGDPKAQVQALLDSGRMSQAQYNQIQGMAQQLMGILR